MDFLNFFLWNHCWLWGQDTQAPISDNFGLGGFGWN